LALCWAKVIYLGGELNFPPKTVTLLEIYRRLALSARALSEGCLFSFSILANSAVLMTSEPIFAAAQKCACSREHIVGACFVLRQVSFLATTMAVEILEEIYCATCSPQLLRLIIYVCEREREMRALREKSWFVALDFSSRHPSLTFNLYVLTDPLSDLALISMRVIFHLSLIRNSSLKKHVNTKIIIDNMRDRTRLLIQIMFLRFQSTDADNVFMTALLSGSLAFSIQMIISLI